MKAFIVLGVIVGLVALFALVLPKYLTASVEVPTKYQRVTCMVDGVEIFHISTEKDNDMLDLSKWPSPDNYSFTWLIELYRIDPLGKKDPVQTGAFRVPSPATCVRVEGEYPTVITVK